MRQQTVTLAADAPRGISHGPHCIAPLPTAVHMRCPVAAGASRVLTVSALAGSGVPDFSNLVASANSRSDQTGVHTTWFSDALPPALLRVLGAGPAVQHSRHAAPSNSHTDRAVAALLGTGPEQACGPCTLHELTGLLLRCWAAAARRALPPSQPPDSAAAFTCGYLPGSL